MEKDTNISQSQSNTQDSAKETNNSNSLDDRIMDMSNNKQLFKNTEIKYSPFTLKESEEKGWSIGLGNQAITNWSTDELEKIRTINIIENGTIPNWNFMVTAIAAITDLVIEKKTFNILKEMAEEKNN